MIHPFEALRPEYTTLLAQMRIIRTEETDETARKLLGLVAARHYDEACDAAGVPRAWAAASFEREASSNFRLSPAQGDPWNEVSRHVPRGVGPFASWAAAAIFAYRHESLDKVGVSNWSWERACFEAEAFNGFGYRARGVHSPYLWAGTNHYARGKFVADGRFDPNAHDGQLGVIPVMRRMVQINKLLEFALPKGGGLAEAGNAAPPITPPEGVHNAATLQEHLNALGSHLTVDGNYGRITRAAVRDFQTKANLVADGFAGPQTWRAIDAAIAAR